MINSSNDYLQIGHLQIGINNNNPVGATTWDDNDWLQAVDRNICPGMFELLIIIDIINSYADIPIITNPNPN